MRIIGNKDWNNYSTNSSTHFNFCFFFLSLLSSYVVFYIVYFLFLNHSTGLHLLLFNYQHLPHECSTFRGFTVLVSIVNLIFAKIFSDLHKTSSLCACFFLSASSDLSQHVVTDCKQAIDLLEEGIANRITAATHNHDASSRSHAIFTIQYTQVIPR